MMKCDDREVAMRLGQLEPCEHDALLKVGGESLIRREIQIQRGVSRNWAGPGTGRVTSILDISAMTPSIGLKTMSQECLASILTSA